MCCRLFTEEQQQWRSYLVLKWFFMLQRYLMDSSRNCVKSSHIYPLFTHHERSLSNPTTYVPHNTQHGGSFKWKKKNKWMKREKKPRSRLCKAKKNEQKTDDKLAEESVGVNERKKIKQISVFLSAGSLFCYLSGLLLFFGSVLCCVVKRKWKLKEPRSTQKRNITSSLQCFFFLSLCCLIYLLRVPLSLHLAHFDVRAHAVHLNFMVSHVISIFHHRQASHIFSSSCVLDT